MTLIALAVITACVGIIALCLEVTDLRQRVARLEEENAK